MGNSQVVQKIDRFLFVLLAKVSISQCHGHALVSQYLLDLFEACTLHNQVRGKCMP